MNKLKSSAKFEIVGMAIVLLSAAWSLLLASSVDSVFSDSRFFYIEDKLDTMWGVVAALYSHSSANTENVMAGVNFHNALENWKEYGSHSRNLASQSHLFSLLGAFSFLIGSACLLFGKYLKEKDA
jgi:hypothetical protein